MTQMSAGPVPGISGIGSGIPLAAPVREVAKRAVPDGVVSAGYGSLVLLRAWALLAARPAPLAASARA